LDFAILQSDVQFYAFKGYGPFRGKGPATKLRAVVSLQPEAFISVLPPNKQAAALCANKIDVMVLTVAHPNAALRKHMASCRTNLGRE